MREYNLFQQMFPAVAEYFTEDYDSPTEQMLDLVLDSTDLRIEDGKRVNPAFMFAAILWYPMNKLADKLVAEQGMAHYDAIMEASNIILDQQVKSIAIPRRHTATIREVWQLQLRLPRRNGKRAVRLMELNKFRAGYDFLEMRGEIEGGETKELAKWWERYQTAGRNMRQAMANDVAAPSKSGHRRRKTYRNKKSKQAE
jgi:poly(A) polymerase